MSDIPVITYCSNAHEILGAIVERLFLHETKRHQRCIDTIAERHSVWYKAFLFKAQTYRLTDGVAGRVALPERAWEDMELFLKDKEMVERDSRQVWQMLFPAIVPCTSLQDVRDILPDMLVDMIPELNTLPRTKEEMWSVQDDQRLVRKYKDVRDRMELYVRLSKNPELASLISLYHFEA